MKKPIIKEVTVKRFRSYQEETIIFDNPLFLVGRNGAGKSNLADLFSFLAETMTIPLQGVFDKRGGINAVRNRSSIKSRPPNLGIAITFGALNGEVNGARYAFEIKALPNYGFKVLREQCTVDFVDGRRFWYDRQRDFVTNANGLKPSLDPAALALPVVGGDRRFNPLLKTLASMRVYSIDPAKLREMQDPDGGTTLNPDGSNAASVLQDLMRINPEARVKLPKLLEAIVPNTTAVKPKKHANKLSLEFTQEWKGGKLHFDAFNMSDGTLRALGILTAVFQTPPPSVLVIEEPEATIHPGALGAVLDLVRRAAKNTQVLITTHSPEVLDERWIEHRHLRIVVWQDGTSYVVPADETSLKAMQEHLMGAGELLRSNALNPQPLFAEERDLRQGKLFEEFR